jgi:Bacterial Ig-like domain (group 3)
VAYWATDANSGNGELYVCTASGNPGTWTAIYQPYTYPHPLVSGSSLISTSTGITSSNFTPATGTNITLTASVTPSSGPTGTVQFFDGGSSIGTQTLSSGTATQTVTAITVGSHSYTATYSGDSSYSTSTSSPITVVASSGSPGTKITTGTSFKGGVVVH